MTIESKYRYTSDPGNDARFHAMEEGRFPNYYLVNANRTAASVAERVLADALPVLPPIVDPLPPASLQPPRPQQQAVYQRVADPRPQVFVQPPPPQQAVYQQVFFLAPVYFVPQQYFNQLPPQGLIFYQGVPSYPPQQALQDIRPSRPPLLLPPPQPQPQAVAVAPKPRRDVPQVLIEGSEKIKQSGKAPSHWNDETLRAKRQQLFCITVMSGKEGVVCNEKECQYSHTFKEVLTKRLSARIFFSSNFRQTFCDLERSGICPYGICCNYAHSRKEIELSERYRAKRNYQDSYRVSVMKLWEETLKNLQKFSQ